MRTQAIMTACAILSSLTVVPSVSGKIYKGAELRTDSTFVYGRFAVRMKSVARDGVLASFFTYHDPFPFSEMFWNEIDFEILGRYDDEIQFNAITPGRVNHVGRRQVAFNPHLDFHEYAFEWTPDYVAWFIDGVEVYRQTGSHVQTLNRPQKLMMNIWNPEYPNWVGPWNAAALPAFAYYDWVSYASYTPGAGTTGTGNNFTHQWRDDFDSFDDARWDKATHTFPGNACDFIPDNIVYRNGMMVLCLTHENNIGYTDVNPATLLWAKAVDGKIIARFSEEIDSQTAETVSNYVLPNATVSSARLLSDLRTVELTVSEINPGASYNLIILSMQDRAVPPNLSSLHARQVHHIPPLSLPLKINVGGDSSGTFLKDQEWSERVAFGFQDGGTAYFGSAQISGTADQEIFRSERYGLVYYRIHVPAGTYSVSLMMAENFHNASGARVFDVLIEGSVVVSGLDVFAEAGKHAALVKRIDNVAVVDGTIDIYFAASTDSPVLNGILVEGPVSSLDRGEILPPDDFYLHQNYPNPFNAGTMIRFSTDLQQEVELSVYDLLGREVSTVNVGTVSPGTTSFYWDASDRSGSPLGSGTYVYTIQTQNRRQSRKLILLR